MANIPPGGGLFPSFFSWEDDILILYTLSQAFILASHVFLLYLSRFSDWLPQFPHWKSPSSVAILLGTSQTVTRVTAKFNNIKTKAIISPILLFSLIFFPPRVVLLPLIFFSL